MKEAAGEANLTVIAILLIGVIAAVATPLISNMMTNSAKSSCCQNWGGVMEGGKCVDAIDGTGITGYWDATNKKCNEFS